MSNSIKVECPNCEEELKAPKGGRDRNYYRDCGECESHILIHLNYERSEVETVREARKFVKESNGHYESEDGRFTISSREFKSGYVVYDHERENDFGESKLVGFPNTIKSSRRRVDTYLARVARNEG